MNHLRLEVSPDPAEICHPVRRALKTFPSLRFAKVSYQTYTRAGYPYYALFYYLSGRRVREARSTYKAAWARAKQIDIAVQNGETQLLSFTHGDRARLQFIDQSAAPTKQTAEALVVEAAAAFAELPEGLTLLECVRYARQHRPANGNLVPKNIPELVTEFLIDKQGAIGQRWHRSISQQLTRFAGGFAGPIDHLTSPQINTWLRSLSAGPRPVGPRSRQNYRAAIETFSRWAKDNGHLSRGWIEMQHVANVRSEDAEVRILTPEQLTRLLGVAQPSLVPFIALTAFAGIRHEEMTGSKKLLDWRDISFEHSSIYVQKGVAKTGQDRRVPISENLAAWLLPHARLNGPVCALANTSNALSRAKRRAGIPAGKNETRNTLRKSYISYRLAILKNITQVAEEAGNSPAKIRSNYKNAQVLESEGKRWFNISPSTAEIRQLNFRL